MEQEQWKIPSDEELMNTKSQIKDDDSHLLYVFSRLLSSLCFLAHTSYCASCPDMMRQNLNKCYFVFLGEYKRIGDILYKKDILKDKYLNLPDNVLNATEFVVRDWSNNRRGEVLNFMSNIDQRLFEKGVYIFDHAAVHPYVELLERITAGAVIYFIKEAGMSLEFSKDYFVGDYLNSLSKITIIISKKDGIYRYGDKNKVYKMNDTNTNVRKKIIGLLSHNKVMKGDHLLNMVSDIKDSVALRRNIKKINNNFIENLELEKKLILGTYAKSFSLNREDYHLEFLKE